MKSIIICLSFLFLFFVSQAQKTAETDLKRNGLYGKVRSVKTTSFAAVQKGDTVIKGAKERDIFYSDYDTYQLYNKKGYVIQEKMYESDGKLMEELNYSYDTLGYLTNMKENNQGVLDNYTYKRKFDKSGNLIEKTSMNNNSFSSKVKFKYVNKRIVEEKTYDEKNKLLSIWRYAFDKKGYCIERSCYDEKDSLTFKVSQEINEKGLVSKWTALNSYSKKTTTFTYTYTFDALGNWNRQIIYKGGVARYIVERVIEFY
ncbi:MAG: hypothetical protein V2A54_03695 [Bacteroidota bacterium]